MDTERKLELIRSIRNTHQNNASLLKSREQILYGESIPLVKKGELHSTETAVALETPTDVGVPVMSSFKIRFLIAIVLFCAFLVCDKSGQKILGLTMDEVASQIVMEQEELSTISEKILNFF